MIAFLSTNYLNNFIIINWSDLTTNELYYVLSGFLPILGAFILAIIFKYSNGGVNYNSEPFFKHFIKIYVPKVIKPAIIIATVYFSQMWGSHYIYDFVNIGISPVLYKSASYRGYIYVQAFGIGPFVQSMIPITLSLTAFGLVTLIKSKRSSY